MSYASPWPRQTVMRAPRRSRRETGMIRKNSKILISAAGGKVGQHVVTQLVQKKIPVRACVHSHAKAAALRETGIEAEVLDFESPDSIATAFEGIDTLFLVTPGSPHQGRHEENLLTEAKKAGVKRIVRLSGRISDHHTTGFSRWNLDAERRVKESGIPYSILRGNYFMQNFFASANQIKQGAFTAGPAAKRIAFIDARDIAATAVAALTEDGHAGKTYDLNGPELLDGHAQAAVFSRVLGRPVRYLDVSADDFIGQLKSAGLPPWMVEAFGVATAAKIPGDQSSAEIERILRRKPGTLEQFVKDYRTTFQISG
jgi:uncharacterized protein YbjT (DUF2867 family)